MSGVTRGDGLWHRYRFHLSALMVLVPILAFPGFLEEQRLYTGDSGLGEREIGTVMVGPYPLRLAEFAVGGPSVEGEDGLVKIFSMALCDGCEKQIRAVHARIGQPPSIDDAGSVFEGSPLRLTTDVQVEATARATDGLWLTVERWDGTSETAMVPMDDASPETVDWLRRNHGP